MAIDYDEIAAGALVSIAEAGQAVTVHRPGEGGGYVPGVGVVPAEPPTDHAGTGALFGYKQRDIDGTNIMIGDQRLLLAPQIDTVPDTTCTVTAVHKGKLTTFVVKDVGIVAPAGVPVLYKLQLRGA